MKKAISENEEDTLVMEEIPKNASKTRPVEDSRAGFEGRSMEDELAKRKALLKNIYKNPQSRNLKDTARQEPPVEVIAGPTSVAQSALVSDLLIFQLNDDHTTVKAEWAKLPLRLKEVFEEIVYSLPVSGISDTEDDGCYTFSYADDEFNLSVISIVIEGKAALFYKNADSEAS